MRRGHGVHQITKGPELQLLTEHEVEVPLILRLRESKL